MPWTSYFPAPLPRFPAAPRAPTLRIFAGKPHALAFLADGSLIVGASHGLTLHDPTASAPPRATVELGGGVEWMAAHPDGESVVAAIRDPRGNAVVRVWPTSARVVTLLRELDFGYRFCGGLSPDGARLYWRRNAASWMLSAADVATGSALGEVELPGDTGMATALAVRPDYTVYMRSEGLLVVHPDGRLESHEDGMFLGLNPFFADAQGGMMGVDGKRIAFFDGEFDERDGLPHDADSATISHDRTRLTFHAPLERVQVWDVVARRVIFSTEQPGVWGAGPHWRGQGAASSAAHVAAIDYTDASVSIWNIDQPSQPSATLTGYSQGARRLLFHGATLTVHTCQPPNTRLSVLEIDRASGAAKILDETGVHDVVRTPDGQRLLVMRQDMHRRFTLRVLDAAGVDVESVPVKGNGGALALTPNGAIWGSLVYSRARDPSETACQVQWRAFGAAKAVKTLKLKGIMGCIALCDTAVAAMVGEELVVAALAKGKSLLSIRLPDCAHAIALSPDAMHVAAACRDVARLVRIATGAVVELGPAPRSVCFGDVWLFVGHESGAITQHRVPSGEQVAALYGHTDEVCALSWVDGALWSGSADGTIVQWGDLG
ncbi:hypothetical protein SAMN02745121_09108 [Nannocystis exedens]|uniref:WD40 repeat n=1 Tax=Nannocystis exedens TaxID=54 RepID=A0A1I2J005_9BACT|nr:hypothetical protein [Nannocystis exedens]PCC68174.1 WD domain, G-beta repeat [Nannocystis exedens]SFF47779.1 hypothetical protein SAMN02745121_09108 [Nannocystis exedens]